MNTNRIPPTVEHPEVGHLPHQRAACEDAVQWLARLQLTPGEYREQFDSVFNELAVHVPELTERRCATVAANVVARIAADNHRAGRVAVTLTDAEAMRLYASASSYEHSVDRVVGVGEQAASTASSALTKLAAAQAVREIAHLEHLPFSD